MSQARGPEVSIQLLNAPQGAPVGPSQYQHLLDRPFDVALEEMFGIATGVPETAFRVTREYDVVAQPSEGHATPVQNLHATLGEVLRELRGDKVEIRVDAEARAAGGGRDET